MILSPSTQFRPLTKPIVGVPACLFAGAAIVFLLLLAMAPAGSGADEIRHDVRVTHPAIGNREEIKRTLVQTRGADGAPDTFHMEVDSVTCNDEQCQVVPIRIHWNELGFYTRFDLAPGVTLEKAEGIPFTKSDLAKLHRVLADRDSTLWNLRMQDYLKKPGEGVDVVSSPTIIMDKRRYVEGAVWTCHTLWHWANGDVRSEIRQRTAAATNLEQLRNHLTNGDHDHRVFALQEITNRKAHDPATIKAVLQQVPEEDHAFLKMIMAFVERTPAETYHACIGTMLGSDNRKLRVMCLDSLLKRVHEPPRGFLIELARQFCASDSYQEVHLFLKIVERPDEMPGDIARQIVGLLDHENFLIARRAYWSLADEKLPQPDQNKVEKFRQQHADRL